MKKLLILFIIPLLGYGQNVKKLGLNVDFSGGDGSYESGISLFNKVKKTPTRFIQNHLGLKFIRIKEMENDQKIYEYSIQLKRVWCQSLGKINGFFGFDINVALIQASINSNETSLNILTVSEKSRVNILNYVDAFNFLELSARLGFSHVFQIKGRKILSEIYLYPLNLSEKIYAGLSLGYMFR